MVLNLNSSEGGEDSLFRARRPSSASFGSVDKNIGRGWSAIVSTEGKGDYEDIQSAINDLPYSDKGGRIFIDDGVYLITSSILIDRDDVELVFSNKALVKRKSDLAFNLFTLGNGTTTRYDIIINGLRINDLTGAQHSRGVELDKVERVKFIDCNVLNTHDAPFIVDSDSSFIYFIRCYCDGEFTIAGDNVVVDGCNISDNISVSGDDVIITNSTFTPNSFGLDDTGSNRLIFISNIINVGLDDDIYLVGTDGVFVGNINKNRGTWEWDISGATRLLFLGYDNNTAAFSGVHTDLTGVTSDLHHAQVHNVASHSDTTATGTELNTLTDDSMADSLHRHSELSASDGTPNKAWYVDTVGHLRDNTAGTGIFIIPTVTTAQFAALTAITGMIVYHDNEGAFMIRIEDEWHKITTTWFAD